MFSFDILKDKDSDLELRSSEGGFDDFRTTTTHTKNDPAFQAKLKELYE